MPSRHCPRSSRLWLAAWALLACNETSEAPPEALVPSCPEPVVSIAATPLAHTAAATARVARLDLEGDGRDEIAVASDAGVVLLQVEPTGAATMRWRADAPGGATAVASGDIDGDGIDDLVVGWGQSRAHPQAAATLTAYLSRGAAPAGLRPLPIEVPATPRPQFTHVSVAAPPGAAVGVFYALFTGKYDVVTRHAVLTGDGAAATAWSQSTIASLRMGSHWAVGRFGDSEAATLVVGRPYGDEQKAPGDVFELASGERRPLPAVRGVRSMAAVALGDPAAPRRLICYGAGWHWRYSEQAQALLTCAERLANGRWVAEIVDELGSYEVSDIGAGDIDGDGRIELLAGGPDGLYAYVPTFVGPGLSRVTWKRTTLGGGGGGGHFVAADIDGDGSDEVVSGGASPMIYAVRRSP